MANKFARNYELTTMTSGGESLVIKPPFTLDFNIVRSTLADVSSSTFKIYNLGKSARNLLREDKGDFDKNKNIILKAGYGENLTEVFKGNLSNGFSYRQGTNFITDLTCQDGGYAVVNSVFERSYPKNTQYRSIVKNMAESLAPSVTVGSIGEISGSTTKGNSFSGSPIALINELVGNSIFIDKEKVNILNDSEVLDDPIFVIKPQTGLLATPTRHFTWVNVEMLFEPRISVGARVQLESFSDDSFSGSSEALNSLYKVTSVQHSGVISQSQSGSVKTTIGLQPGKNFTEIYRESR